MTKSKKDQLSVQQLLIPSYIRFIARLLKNTSPFLASRFAAKLFLTPFRYKLPQREKKMDRNSVQTRMKVPAFGKEIVVYHYGDSPDKILLVHGWSGRGTQLSQIAEALVQAGYSTISFDAPGHGKAPGKSSIMTQFIESIHFLDKEFGPFDAAIGHSLGGMASLRAVKEGIQLKKLIIIGTADSVTHITREFNENLGMNKAIADKMKAYFDEKFGEDMDNYSGAVSARAVKTPTLVIHDQQDVDVDVSCAYEIDRALENSELMITQGQGHRRILGDKKVINKITTFLTA
ncbi:alpha/beta fold hydrolase [Salegentibacter sp. F14]